MLFSDHLSLSLSGFPRAATRHLLEERGEEEEEEEGDRIDEMEQHRVE